MTYPTWDDHECLEVFTQPPQPVGYARRCGGCGRTYVADGNSWRRERLRERWRRHHREATRGA